MTKRVVIVSARVGAGHDGAARELTRRLQLSGCSVENYDFLDMWPKDIGQKLCNGYYKQLQTVPRSWDYLLKFLGLPPVAWLAKRFTMLAGPRMLKAIGTDADLVISTYPAANQTLSALKQQGKLRAPFVAYFTDPSTHRLCVTPNADVHIAQTEIGAEQARRMGAGRVVVAAPAIGLHFRPPVNLAERNRERDNFGLPHQERLALVLAGSWGVGEVSQIAHDVLATKVARPVVVCGHNEALRDQLVKDKIPHVFGWVDDMPALMRACDIAVQNAGGLTSLEAMASELPVITYRCLPGHGRANAAVLDKAGQVRWVRKPEDLASALIPSIKRSEPVIGIGDPTELLLSLAEQVPSTKKATKRKATG